MASLVSWLKYSGARKTDGTAVSSGRAYFYVPGTTNTFASVYSDVDGLIPLAVPVVLDAAGKAEVYAKSAVHVEVYDASGTVVSLSDRANTTNAAQVEIENAAATGTDLTNGQQVAGGRTDLNTYLTSLLSSFGAADGKVLIGGAAQNVKDVLSGSTAVFFSVQNSNYNGGAKGNDSTDDTSAIQATVNACVLAGGGIVWFPPGIYKITSAINVNSPKVWLMGSSAAGTILKQYSAANYCVDTSTAADMIPVSQMAFTGGIASALLVKGGIKAYACSFTNNTGDGALNATAANQSFTQCVFNQSAATGSLWQSASASLLVQVVGGTISVPTVSSSYLVSALLTTAGVYQFTGVAITHSAASGTTTLIPNVTNLSAQFSGCQFTCASGATLLLTTISGATPSSVFESGSLFSTPTSLAAFNPGFSLLSTLRETNGLRTSGSATTYSPDALRYQYHDVTSTGASFQFTNPAQIPQSASFSSASRVTLVLRYKNTSGGAITPTFGTNYKIGTAPSVGNNQCAVWFFVFDTINSVFLQVGGNPVAYAA